MAHKLEKLDLLTLQYVIEGTPNLKNAEEYAKRIVNSGEFDDVDALGDALSINPTLLSKAMQMKLGDALKVTAHVHAYMQTPAIQNEVALKLTKDVEAYLPKTPPAIQHEVPPPIKMATPSAQAQTVPPRDTENVLYNRRLYDSIWHAMQIYNLSPLSPFPALPAIIM